MLRQKTARTLLIVALFASSFSFFASTGLSQTRHKLQPPATMLKDLDDEDRTCVVNEGGINKHVRVRLFDISPRTVGEILIRGRSSCLCGAQNCGFWIYQKAAGKYQLLLKGVGATKVALGRSYSQGYLDVVAESHASAIETIIRTYGFDGRQYRLMRCVSRNYFDENGKQIKKPRYRPCD